LSRANLAGYYKTALNFTKPDSWQKRPRSAGFLFELYCNACQRGFFFRFDQPSFHNGYVADFSRQHGQRLTSLNPELMAFPVIQIEPAAADWTLAHDFAFDLQITFHAIFDKLRDRNHRRACEGFSIMLRPRIAIGTIACAYRQNARTQNQYIFHLFRILCMLRETLLAVSPVPDAGI
jgi:hypothetical protein